MPDNVAVDVVIPCHNYAGYLEYCVDSVLSQPGVETRALVIDDCSTDRTETIGRQLAARHAKVEYRRHAVNKGHIDTFNDGVLGWATSEYVLLISADDGLLPGRLVAAVDALNTYPSAAFCHGAAILGEHPPAAAERSGDANRAVRTLSGAEFWREIYALGDNPVLAPTAVVRTRCQHAVGGYRKDMPHTADLHMWLLLATVGDVCEVSEPVAFKRLHPQSMSSGFNRMPLEVPRQLLAAFDDAWAHAETMGLSGSGLVEDARRAIAGRVFWEGSKAFDDGDVVHADRCVSMAVGACPAIEQWPAFGRFKWKRRLGPLGGMIARLAERSRG